VTVKQQAAAATVDTLDEFMAVLNRRKVLWELHIATVTARTNGSTRCNIIVDGDSSPIGADTLIGNLVTGQRVGVIFVPPSGYYVMGNVDGSAVQTAGVVAYASSTSDLVTSGTTNTLALQATGTFKNDHAYQLTFGWGLHVSIAGARADFTAFQDSTGLELIDFGLIVPATISINYQANGTAMFTNTSGHDITDTIDLFLTESGTAGTATWVATAARPRWMCVTDMGIAVDGPISLA
jgi:hypothetical protein